jgi:hypothetical protein
MKSLLAKTGLPKAIGVYVDDQAVTISQVVSTPLGPIETARHSEPVGPDELPAVLERVLKPLAGGGRLQRVPVAIGIPTGRTYFATRPIQNPGSDASPEILLREALRSPNVSVNEMTVDVVKARPDRRPVASIAACQSRYLSGLLEALERCGVRPHRAEPAPCALLRAAANQHRSRRQAKVVVRLILGDAHVLAALVVDDLPVLWRQVPLRQGDEAATLLSVTRSVMAVSKDCGVQSPLDAVMIHGRTDLLRLLDVEWVESQLGATVQWLRDPPLESGQVAFGLALGCLGQEERAFDLSHSLKRSPSLWEVFPWRQVAIQVGLVLCLAFVLFDHSNTLTDSYDAIRVQNSQHFWMESLQDAQLIKERDELRQKVAAVRKFLRSRIAWSTHQRAVAACLPENVYLTSFQGVSELGEAKKKPGQGRPKQSLVLSVAAPMAEDGVVPPEVDRFVDQLRAHPAITADFPVVAMADLKQQESKRDGARLSSFTVICLPKTVGGAAR